MQPKTFDELIDSVKNKTIVGGITKEGNKHRFFISTNGQLCRFIPRSSRRGYYINYHEFSNYTNFVEAPAEKTQEQKLKKQYNEIAKYKRMAMQASFTNSFIEDCKAIPDFETWKKDVVDNNFGTPCEPRPKSLYELHITTGNKIDGKVISLSRIEKKYPRAIERLREAIKNKQAVGNIISNVRFAGYDMSISVEQKMEGIMGYLNLEYKGCGNGYYYLLINDENFIGYDVD